MEEPFLITVTALVPGVFPKAERKNKSSDTKGGKWHEARRQAIFLFPLQMMLKSQPVAFQQFTTTSKNLSVYCFGSCSEFQITLNTRS